jgi:hypothetical protein
MANTFKNYASKNVGTSAATVVTAATSTTVIGLSVSCLVATAITTDVYVTTGGTDYYIVKGATVLPGGALVVVGGDQKLVLETGDALKVVTNTASSADVFCSVLEIS